MQNQREFTESWLQALTLSADHTHARSIRPWLTTIQTLAASEPSEEQAAEAQKLWEYASSHGLTPLIECLPAELQSEDTLARKARWLRDLGITPIEVPAVAHVTASDWSNALRKEAVRKGKPLNVSSIPAGSMLDLPCQMRWDMKTWTVHFAQPDWMRIVYESPFRAPRPEMEVLTEYLIDALGVAEEKFKPAMKLSAFTPETSPWTICIPDFSQWHREVLLTQSIGLSPWMRRTWNCVWPVIMRERNRLRGPCDLQYLRTELKACFDSEPAMVEWMFILARLACELRIGTGLGLCGDFE